MLAANQEITTISALFLDNRPKKGYASKNCYKLRYVEARMSSLSKYTYISSLDTGDVCLYNSLQGMSSICVLKCISVDKAKAILNRNSDAIKPEDKATLRRKGHLIDSESNEFAIRNFKMAELVFGRYLYLVVYTTENCNFCCEYCFQEHRPRSLSQETAESIIKFVTCELFKYQGVKISWFGGEPLLEIDIIEKISSRIKAVCRQAKKVFWAEITTNGYLLTLENIKRLIACNVVDYTITLDGPKENHNKYRHTLKNESSYDVIMTNLKAIRDSIHRNSISVLIRTNVTKDSMIGLRDFYTTLDSIFGSDKRFSLLLKPVYDWGGARIENIKPNLLDDFNLSILYKAVSNFNLKLKFWGNLSGLEFGGQVCQACYANKWTIGVDGQVSKCDTCSPTFSVGQLKGGILTAKAAAYEWCNQIFDMESKCQKCVLGGICFGGACPKKQIFDGVRTCFHENGIDALLNLAVNTISEEKEICTISVM